MIGTRILFIDDEPRKGENIAQGIQNIWKELFHEEVEVQRCRDVLADEAAPGNETRTLSSLEQFDAILLDVLWPSGAHGIDLAKQIRQRYRTKPIIVLSEHAKPQHFHELIKIGIQAYLSKEVQSAHPWCVEIRRVLEDVAKSRPGYPLFYLLKRSLIHNSGAWCGDEVMAAASRVWSDETAYQKWESFWGCWTEVLGRNHLKNACDSLGSFFRGKELLMLSVHSGFRGHLEHVLHVYFTGYLISHSPGFKDVVLEAVQDLLGRDYKAGAQSDYWDFFQISWLMAATLHDVAYPLEMLPDVSRVTSEIRKTFDFAEFEGKTETLVPKGINWASPPGKAARESFRFILERLYKNSGLADLVEQRAEYSAKGMRRFNHGIASGIVFRHEAEKWSAGHGLPPEFMKWIAVAMGIHSLKNAAEEIGLKVSPKRDPLTFLLCLSDELQVWNRSRPDETAASGHFRGVELVGLDIEGSKLTARIEYDLFPMIDDARRTAAVSAITTGLEKDQSLLGRFLDPKPFEVIIQSRIRDPEKELPEIRLV